MRRPHTNLFRPSFPTPNTARPSFLCSRSTHRQYFVPIGPIVQNYRQAVRPAEVTPYEISWPTGVSAIVPNEFPRMRECGRYVVDATPEDA